MTEKHLKAAEARGAKKIDRTAEKIRAAIELIVSEMNANAGIYPHNGGVVTQAELYRRAEVSETTIYKSQHSDLKKFIANWIVGLKSKEVIGRMRVRRTYAERADDWKARYLALQDHHIITELELQNNQLELEKIRSENEALRKLLEHQNGTVIASIKLKK